MKKILWAAGIALVVDFVLRKANLLQTIQILPVDVGVGGSWLSPTFDVKLQITNHSKEDLVLEEINADVYSQTGKVTKIGYIKNTVPITITSVDVNQGISFTTVQMISDVSVIGLAAQVVKMFKEKGSEFRFNGNARLSSGISVPFDVVTKLV